MGEGCEHHFGPIIILLWVLSGLKWGSAPLILREKIIVNLRHGNTRKLFNTPQRDPPYRLRSNCVGASASITAVAEFGAWPSVRCVQQIRCIYGCAGPNIYRCTAKQQKMCSKSHFSVVNTQYLECVSAQSCFVNYVKMQCVICSKWSKHWAWKNRHLPPSTNATLETCWKWKLSEKVSNWRQVITTTRQRAFALSATLLSDSRRQ